MSNSNNVEVGQLWVVFDSDVYLNIKSVNGNMIKYNRVGISLYHEMSYDDFIAYAINSDDVVGDYEHWLVVWELW